MKVVKALRRMEGKRMIKDDAGKLITQKTMGKMKL